MEYFSYIKSLHIIFVITWFAGLFYIPRLFIYFIEASSKPSPDKKILMDQFTLMMNRLWFVITWPSSVLAILFGFWMIVLVPNWLLENWMIAKLGFVFLLIIYPFPLNYQLINGYQDSDWDTRFDEMKSKHWSEYSEWYLMNDWQILLIEEEE